MASSSISVSALLLALVATALHAQSDDAWPQPGSGYVTDYAQVLSTNEEERIEQLLMRVERESGTEIIVLAIESIEDYPRSENGSIEAFATALFNKWGIGNRPRNDGILLLVAERDRKARIELGEGYPASRDGDAARIMAEIIVPQFREGDYAAGIIKGVKAIVSEFTPVSTGPPWALLGFGGGAIVLLIVGISLLQSGKRGWGWVIVGLALVIFSALLYIILGILRHSPRRRSSSWAAGGIGGFGGGSSRGGGATGSW